MRPAQSALLLDLGGRAAADKAFLTGRDCSDQIIENGRKELIVRRSDPMSVDDEEAAFAVSDARWHVDWVNGTR
jgi:hypothetical protein